MTAGISPHLHTKEVAHHGLKERTSFTVTQVGKRAFQEASRTTFSHPLSEHDIRTGASNVTVERAVDRQMFRSPIASLPTPRSLQEDQLLLDSILRKESPDASIVFERSVSNREIMVLFFEILILIFQSDDLERVAQKQEREILIQSMKEVVANLKGQGTTLLITGITTGVFSILSGLAPMFGHCKAGDGLKDKISTLMTSAKEIDKEPFFRNLGKMFQGLSQSSDNGGKIYTTLAQASQVREQTRGDVAKTDRDDFTRKRQTYEDSMRKMADFVLQVYSLQQRASEAIFSRQG